MRAPLCDHTRGLRDGVFAAWQIRKMEVVRIYCSSLVYSDLGSREFTQDCYGEGMLKVLVVEFKRWAIQLSLKVTVDCENHPCTPFRLHVSSCGSSTIRVTSQKTCNMGFGRQWGRGQLKSASKKSSVGKLLQVLRNPTLLQVCTNCDILLGGELLLDFGKE